MIWKSFEPFSENDSGEELFGFGLSAGEINQDFYTNNEDELDVWVSNFRKISILSGVHDDFTFGSKLGEGNYSKVHRATDNESGALVAIKCIAKDKIKRSSQGPKILVNEIFCMRSLAHPNVLRLERVYEEDEFVYLVLEYVEGGDLFAKIIAAEKFSEKYSAVIARKILSALAYMTQCNIIHRDIKLENILMSTLDEESDIKIADFGFGAEMTLDNLSHFCGSPGYIAPEILDKRSYCSKADVFSLGVIVSIIISGNSPFFGRTVEETLAKNRSGVINFESPFWTSISDEAKDFVTQLTQRNPELRPTAAEALKHSWIYKHNKQHFDSLTVSLQRPSFSKRRPTISFEEVKSPMQPQFSEASSSQKISPRVRPRFSAVSQIAEGFLTPGAKYINITNSAGSCSPSTNSPLISLISETSSPASVRISSGRRNVSWKQIKPHP